MIEREIVNVSGQLVVQLLAGNTEQHTEWVKRLEIDEPEIEQALQSLMHLHSRRNHLINGF